MLLAYGGKPLLLEFGAARRVIGDMTQALTVILKPGYAPVEQYAAMPNMRQGPWTDVYALAATVYWTVTGETPPSAVGRMVADAYVPLAQTAAGRYSAGFLQAIDRALIVQPEERTQTIAELRYDLGIDGVPSMTSMASPQADDDMTVFRHPSTPPLRVPSSRVASRPPAPTRGLGARLIDIAMLPVSAVAAIAMTPIVLARGVIWAYLQLKARTEVAEPAEQAEVGQPLMFGVSAPAKCSPGNEFSLVFMAYVEAARATTLKQVQALVGKSHRRLLDVTPDGSAIWRKGTPFTIRASGRAFSVDPPEQTFEWSGSKNIVSFAARVLPGTLETAVLSILVLVQGVPIANIPVEIKIEGREKVATSAAGMHEDARPAPRTLFASYASKDARDVGGRLSTLARWAPRLDIFQDCLDLRPNETYKPQLAQQIASRDAFLLFWSRNAASSTWVRWEFETALARKPRDTILPMPLEDPAIAPPPKELEDLHFRDRFLLAAYAMGAISERRETDS